MKTSKPILPQCMPKNSKEYVIEILENPTKYKDGFTYFKYWLTDYIQGLPYSQKKDLLRAQIFVTPLTEEWVKDSEYVTHRIVDRRKHTYEQEYPEISVEKLPIDIS